MTSPPPDHPFTKKKMLCEHQVFTLKFRFKEQVAGAHVEG